MTEKSNLHKAALRYAERGIPVFPCIPWAEDDPREEPHKRGKKPYGPFAPNGFKSGTTDPALIDKWWTAKPDLNIGAMPHAAGCCVVDIDAPEAVDELNMLYGQLPATFTVRTPRQGLHMWFKGDLPPSVGGFKKNGDLQGLARKVDTRGHGSYVLLPPSLVNGNYYEVVDKTPPADVPQAFIDATKPKAGPTDRAAPEHIKDQPFMIQKGMQIAKSKVAGDHPSLEGNCDNTAIKIAFELADIGLSAEGVYHCLQNGWNVRLRDPMTEDRIWVKAYSSQVNGQNDTGVWAGKDPQVEFANFAGQVHATAANKYTPLDEAEQDALPPPTWLLPGVLPADQLVMLYAPSKGWKTFLALDWGMCVATGNPKWGAVQATPVVYIAAEGATGLGKVRRPSWKLLHAADKPSPFHIIPHMPHVSMEGQVGEMIAAIKAKIPGGCKLLVIDTLARFMAGFDESGAKDAGVTIEALEHIKRELGCTIICLHHTGKDANRGERGSSALRAGFDSGFELIADKANGTAEVWARWHKDAETPNHPWHLKAEQVLDSMAFRFAEADELPIKDRLLPSDIGFVLRTMGVFGKELSVPAPVLVPGIATMKSWSDAKAKVALAQLAKTGKLRAYEVEDGRYCLSEGAEEIPFD